MTTAKLRQCGDSIKVIFSKSISKKMMLEGKGLYLAWLWPQ